mgnify:CR=1 FL=1
MTCRDLNQKLVSLFEERLKNHVYRDNMATRSDLPDKERIEKTVFIKAPRSLFIWRNCSRNRWTQRKRAEPIGLQLDSLK